MFFMLYIMGDISGGGGAWGVPPQTECILNEIFGLKAFINKCYVIYDRIVPQLISVPFFGTFFHMVC